MSEDKGISELVDVTLNSVTVEVENNPDPEEAEINEEGIE